MLIQVSTLKLKRFRYLPLSRSLVYLTLLTLILLLLLTPGLTDEAFVSLQGDMPRYLMNGVYFYDLLRDLPLTHPLTYTYLYYARYPALSLGHHPLLLSLAEAPFYALFGVSIFSAKLTVLTFWMLGLWFWFWLIRTLYDPDTAFLASLLLITTPFLVHLSRVVLSEIPTLALILITSYYLHRYLQSNQNRYALAFALSFVLSAYAKHLALLMFPIFLGYGLVRQGVFKLFSKPRILCFLLIGVLLLPLIPLTLKFSQTNVSWITYTSQAVRTHWGQSLLSYPQTLWNHLLNPAVLLLSLIGGGLALYRRDSRSYLFLLWIGVFYVEITYLGIKNPRYAIYGIPAFCLLAATSLQFFEKSSWKVFLWGVVLTLGVYQFVLAYKVQPEYARGYEEAAQYVVENRKGASVLYSADVDTGYFIFFVRNHDPHRELIVLRADKVLATSRLSRIVEERITQREQIYEILRDFGVGYVVLEDLPYESPSLEWLREEVQGERFVLRKKIPIQSNHPKLKGVNLVIYEYKDYKPPGQGKKLQMNIPLMGDSIRVQFDELLNQNTSSTR